jgi:hypothetical protein
MPFPMNELIGFPFQPIGKPPDPMFIMLAQVPGFGADGADSSSTTSPLTDVASASMLTAIETSPVGSGYTNLSVMRTNKRPRNNIPQPFGPWALPIQQYSRSTDSQRVRQ